MKTYLKRNRGFVMLTTLSVTIFLPLALLSGLAFAVAVLSGTVLGIGVLKMTGDLRDLSNGSIDISDSD